MVHNQAGAPPRFTLRHIFVAVTTCAIAFAVTTWEVPPPVAFAAGCVPVFWLGLVAATYGTALARSARLSLVGELLVALGVAAALDAGLAGAFAALFGLVEWAIMGKPT